MPAASTRWLGGLGRHPLSHSVHPWFRLHQYFKKTRSPVTGWRENWGHLYVPNFGVGVRAGRGRRGSGLAVLVRWKGFASHKDPDHVWSEQRFFNLVRHLTWKCVPIFPVQAPLRQPPRAVRPPPVHSSTRLKGARGGSEGYKPTVFEWANAVREVLQQRTKLDVLRRSGGAAASETQVAQEAVS